MEIIGTSVIAVGTAATTVGTGAKAVGTSQNTANVVAHSQNDKTTLWKQGPEKDFYPGGKKYFTITNLYNQKVLTAVEGTPASLDIKGKPKHTNFPVKLFADSFKSLYRHCIRSITADSSLLNWFQVQILYKFLTIFTY